jgi:hypothetical protein
MGIIKMTSTLTIKTVSAMKRTMIRDTYALVVADMNEAGELVRSSLLSFLSVYSRC